jgi:hypothetical protein
MAESVEGAAPHSGRGTRLILLGQLYCPHRSGRSVDAHFRDSGDTNPDRFSADVWLLAAIRAAGEIALKRPFE